MSLVVCSRCGMRSEVNERFLSAYDALMLHRRYACKHPSRWQRLMSRWSKR